MNLLLYFTAVSSYCTVSTHQVSPVLLRKNRSFIATNVTRQYPLVLLLRLVGDSVVRCEVKTVACCGVLGGCSRGRELSIWVEFGHFYSEG